MHACMHVSDAMCTHAQLGPDNLENLKKIAEQYQGGGEGGGADDDDDDDDVPDLEEDFEQTSKSA